jgi:hypothetical protein
MSAVRSLPPRFFVAALVALMGAAASLLAVNHALAHLPELLRICLGVSVSLFPMYAAVRAYTSLKEITSSEWIRGGIAMALLLTGHGGIILVAARQAELGPIELLRTVLA